MQGRHDTDDRIQKSLKGRFLFIIGLLFFGVYLFLGIMVIFWKKFPIDMPQNYRTALGIVLIVYAVLRFARLLQKK